MKRVDFARGLGHSAGLSRVGAVAQLGERVVRNDEVRGSIPLSSTTRGMSSETDPISPHAEPPQRRVIRPRPVYDKLVVFQIFVAFLGLLFSVPLILGIRDPLRLLAIAFSEMGGFVFAVGMPAMSLGAFFLVAVAAAGPGMAERPFEIDADTGTTIDARGRQWVRERHGPAKVMMTRAGPAAIVFPAFDIVGGIAPAPPPPPRTGRVRSFLQRSFTRVFLGVRGAEIDSLILPIGYLTDREAIMAAIKPEPPPFRWW